MGFPVLAAAIHGSGLPQWRIAELSSIRESRLSRIVRRGVVTVLEREALSRVLGVDESELFAAGPKVRLNTGETPTVIGGAATTCLRSADTQD